MSTIIIANGISKTKSCHVICRNMPRGIAAATSKQSLLCPNYCK